MERKGWDFEQFSETEESSADESPDSKADAYQLLESDGSSYLNDNVLNTTQLNIWKVMSSSGDGAGLNKNGHDGSEVLSGSHQSTRT